MRLLMHTCSSPDMDLALEEAIQREMESAADIDVVEPTWRLWQAARPAVVLGTGQEHAQEVDMAVARDEGIAVLRRHSGGGAVVIGPGAINYSGFYCFDALPGSDTITGAMEAGLAPVVAALARLGVRAQFAGLSDLAVPGEGGALRKLAGNSQARKRHTVLVHGTLLSAPDWAMMARLLPFPSRSPDYRAGRDHRAFLTSLAEQCAPTGLEAFAEALEAVLPGAARSHAPAPSETDRAQRLLEEKYARDEWHLRR